MTLTVATADEMAEHRRRVALGRPWPLVVVVWFERAKATTVEAAKPRDLLLWMGLAKFFGAFR